MNVLTAEIDPDVPDEESHDAPPASAWRTILMTAEGRLGLMLSALMLVLVLAGNSLATHNPTELATGRPLEGPSTSHLLGTDHLGRDVFSRFLTGGRTLLLAPLAAVTLALVIGGGLGLLAAYRRDFVDSLVGRVFDLFIALPSLLIVLVLIAGLGASRIVIIVTVAAVFAPRLGRSVRGAAQAIVTSDYIASAQARGEGTFRILVRELLPNAASPIIATYCLYLTYGILFVATLSFLGLGAQPPSSDWGLMVAENRSFIVANGWATVIPALGIAALSISFTLLGDALMRHLARQDAGAVEA